MTNLQVLETSSLIRVLVVDDSAVVRGLISRNLDGAPGIQVVGSAANGELALAVLARRPVDVVVLDIEMPIMDGMTALGHIVSDYPHVRVIMASTLTLRNAQASLKALSAGASDYVPKPESGLGSAEAFQRELITKVRALGLKSKSRPAVLSTGPTTVSPARPSPTGSQSARWPSARKPTVLAIGASTGGPPALQTLFSALKGRVSQPILLTQHMPPTFTALLAEQLARAGERPCAEARDGEPILPGRCYVAPGGWHMVVERDAGSPILRLNQEPQENFCRPAVDPMLRSAAKVFGGGVLAVILTGMGHDGAQGCQAVSGAGGRFITQDEASSVVWGMPGAATATGLAEAVMPLSEIGPWICREMGTTS